jgi:hypothetical protein
MILGWRMGRSMTQARTASPEKSPKTSTVKDVARLLVQMQSGDLAPEDWRFAQRCLAKYRAKYRNGSISDRTARQLGLIDAQGNEQSWPAAAR